MHKGFQLYARDLQPGATSKEMVRYCLRFAGEAVIHGLSALDVDISQAQIRCGGTNSSRWFSLLVLV